MKPIWMTGLAALLVCAPAGLASASASVDFQTLPADQSDLAPYRWDRRVVLIFAPSETDPQFRAARKMVEAQAAGISERDITILADTTPEMAGALRGKFGVDGFRMLLIGKDGGVKMDRAEPISAETLFSTIDAMPMRQREMRGD
ncbi:DUF4174 domain-containing protein [Thioclava sp. JE_KL1]|uniref:DUF4174 domain-containing protein n=1 Tax=Thioclava sp. JE_KL1 TaxID=2651187 RepID=UPI00128B7672|nr:DUF4174 domain-containing protein [Thioclava sp. JE_KL1]MPQ94044.1 DUF4174 domain-containing protein [Thioclava sp. JE_KL1]